MEHNSNEIDELKHLILEQNKKIEYLTTEIEKLKKKIM